jgi:hypothetical protein
VPSDLAVDMDIASYAAIIDCYLSPREARKRVRFPLVGAYARVGTDILPQGHSQIDDRWAIDLSVLYSLSRDSRLGT